MVYVFGHADFPAANGGTLATSGDFNGDGRPDFVALNYERSTVAILIGQADGSFTDRGVSYPVGVHPGSAAVGDFDNDGFLDVAVMNQVCDQDPCAPGTVSILLGTGDGTFRPAVEYQTAPNPVAIIAGDFNGDGNLDLAVAAAVSRISTGAAGVASILLGNGDGTFRPHVDSPAGTGVIGLVAGDIDRDGNLDLVIDNHPSLASQTVSLLRGRGDGTFDPGVAISVGADPISLAVGDFNGDGNPDLAACTGPGQIAVLLGNGNGTFGPPVNYPSGPGPFRIVVADLNADGRQDLIVSITTSLPTNGSISVLLGNGNGTFMPRVEYGTGTFGQLAVGDFNSDGWLDVAVAKGASTVSVVLGNGDGTLAHPSDYAAGNTPAAIAAGDFDGDGILDLAIANSQSGGVSILLGRADGSFGPPTSLRAGNEPIALATADINNDGWLDLAVINALDGTVSIYLGNGNGTFMPPANAATGARPSSLVAVDLDRDGNLDLAVTSREEGAVSILLGRGDGTFNPRVSYPAGPGAAGIAAGDFNRDGFLDLAVADAGTPIGLRGMGLVSILLGNGDGTLRPHLDSNTASVRPVDLISADFNRDGNPDLAVVTNLSQNGFGSASIMTGNGQGLFQLTNSYACGRFSTPIASADFNLDGNLDLAVGNVGSNTASIWDGRGDGTFQSQSHYGTGVAPSGIAVGDFNGDGAPDMAVINQGASTVSVFLSVTP